MINPTAPTPSLSTDAALDANQLFSAARHPGHGFSPGVGQSTTTFANIFHLDNWRLTAILHKWQYYPGDGWAQILRKSIVSLALLLSLFPLSNHFIYSAEITYLKKVNNYPKNVDDYYFRSLVDLAITNSDLFAVENFSHVVLKFDYSRNNIKFIKQIGRPGQGPGDLHLPNSLSIYNDEIAVKDGQGLSFFSTEGVFKRRFRPNLSNPMVLYLYDLIYIQNSNPEDRHLFEIYSKEGSLLGNFGEKFLSINPGLSKGFNLLHIGQILYDGKLLTDSSYLYYFNNKFGEYFKYDLKGRLILNKNLSNSFGALGEAAQKENKRVYFEEGLKSGKDGSMDYPLFYMFKDAAIHSAHIYFLCEDYIPAKDYPEGEIIIKALNLDTFELYKEYRIRKENVHEDRAISFLVAEKEGLPIFLISMHSEDGYVLNVYK